MSEQPVGSFASSEPPKPRPKRGSQAAPQRVRVESSPAAKTVIIILAIIAAAIIIWIVALGPYMNMPHQYSGG